MKNEPDPKPDKGPRPNPPTSEQLASMATALYPHVKGKDRAIAAAQAALEVWEASERVIMGRKIQSAFKLLGNEELMKGGLGKLHALPGDPEHGSKLPKLREYLAHVWPECGKPSGQNIEKLKDHFRKCVGAGYSGYNGRLGTGGDPAKVAEAELQALIRAEESGDGIEWDAFEVALIRHYFQPEVRGKRTPKTPEPAQKTGSTKKDENS